MLRFQFTIRGLLWATFWVAACAIGWGLYLRHVNDPGGPGRSAEAATGVVVGILGALLAIIAIFGRGKIAFWLIVAALVAMALAAYLWWSW